MGGQNQSALSGVARTANSRWYCYMIVMEGRNERGERAREGAPSPGVVQAVGSGVRPVGIGAKRTVIGGAGVEHASCGTWRGTRGTWVPAEVIRPDTHPCTRDFGR